jgi:hypothetical protein
MSLPPAELSVTWCDSARERNGKDGLREGEVGSWPGSLVGPPQLANTSTRQVQAGQVAGAARAGVGIGIGIGTEMDGCLIGDDSVIICVSYNG